MLAVLPVHLSAIFARYGIVPADAQLLGRSQNEVYRCTIDGELSVLRISIDRGRTLQQIEAELAWIRELADRGVPVATPRRLRRESWCEPISLDGHTYLVARFAFAPGRRITLEDISPALFYKLGQLLGTMHRATLDDPTRPDMTPFIANRPAWHASRLLNDDVHRYLPRQDSVFTQTMSRLVADLKAIPIDPRQYGPVHGDVSFGNVHLVESTGELVLYDFDNCEVGWTMQDLATAIYDSAYCKPPSSRQQIAETWTTLFAGYASVREPFWLTLAARGMLRDFLILREAIIYVHYHRMLDFTTLSISQQDGIALMRDNVERRIPCADVDRLLS